MHSRNRHTGRYDFGALTAECPELRPFLRENPHGDTTIDFGDPNAVRLLNRALLSLHYGIRDWNIPENALCPPIPGRADYIHGAADLLASASGGEIPRGLSVRVLDVGVGSSAVYPLIGTGEYGWSFVGSDVNAEALESAERIVAANPHLREAIEFRRTPSVSHILRGVIRAGETFAMTVCNPPFFASVADANAANERKWRNLGAHAKAQENRRNFGGLANELWCAGGEVAFIRRMIDESRSLAHQVGCFTTLVSRGENLTWIEELLHRAGAKVMRLEEMTQGQKISRFVAWSFFPEPELRSFVKRVASL